MAREKKEINCVCTLSLYARAGDHNKLKVTFRLVDAYVKHSFILSITVELFYRLIVESLNTTVSLIECLSISIYGTRIYSNCLESHDPSDVPICSIPGNIHFAMQTKRV